MKMEAACTSKVSETLPTSTWYKELYHQKWATWKSRIDKWSSSLLPICKEQRVLTMYSMSYHICQLQSFLDCKETVYGTVFVNLLSVDCWWFNLCQPVDSSYCNIHISPQLEKC
jgi:hypothetical protein